MSSKGRQPVTVHGQPSKQNLLQVSALMAEQQRIRKRLARHDRALKFLNRRKVNPVNPMKKVNTNKHPDYDGIKERLMSLPAPVTTTSVTDVHPEWLRGGSPGAIKAQEKRGQQELVSSTQLPTKCAPELKARLVAAGVVFGAETPGDPLFCSAILPKGWKKEGSDHDMWSYLVDGKGIKQASIFYKAAFYDRDAFLGEA